MNPTEFKKAMADLSQRKAQLKAQYIQANVPFRVGSRIKYKDLPAVVSKIDVDPYARVYVTAKRIKKNGDVSMKTVSFYWSPLIDVKP